jgi:hypothetical protein
VCDSERPCLCIGLSTGAHDDSDALQYEAGRICRCRSMLGHMHRRHSVPERPAMACITCDTAVLRGLTFQFCLALADRFLCSLLLFARPYARDPHLQYIKAKL